MKMFAFFAMFKVLTKYSPRGFSPIYMYVYLYSNVNFQNVFTTMFSSKTVND